VVEEDVVEDGVVEVEVEEDVEVGLSEQPVV
jgi:hypothetical protein